MAGRLSAASELGGGRHVIPLTQGDREGQRVAPRQISKAQWRQLELYLDATHLCMQMRGVREQQPTTQTTFWRGAYESNEALRAEFLATCRVAVGAVLANG
jgi:hypothetical protein